MALRKRKIERLNSTNASSVANRGLNASWTQSHNQFVMGDDGVYREGDRGYTSSSKGRLSTNGKTAGGSTWTFTPKNNDGTAVLNKKGEARQSGRSRVATRRQRYYDVRLGLGLVGG